MSGPAYLAGAVTMAVVLSTALWLLRRRPRSPLSGIDEFRREMDALAPPPGPGVDDDGRSGRRAPRPEPIVPAARRADLGPKLRAARRRADRRPDRGW